MENENLTLEAIKRFLVLSEEGILDQETCNIVNLMVRTRSEEEIIECHKYLDKYEKAKGIKSIFHGRYE